MEELVVEKPEMGKLEMEKLVITLKVAAAELYELTYPPSRTDIYKHCYISDSKSTKIFSGDAIEQFESEVERGQPVSWEGSTTESPAKSEYTVAIESVVYAFYKENPVAEAKKVNFFNSMAICRANGKDLLTHVRRDLEPGTLVHIYNINFNIDKKGGVVRRYSIDPRLKIER